MEMETVKSYCYFLHCMKQKMQSHIIMVKTFKKHNHYPQWLSTKVMISDKDFNDRAIFKKEFPDAALHLCLFHTLRSFKREITTEKWELDLENKSML